MQRRELIQLIAALTGCAFVGRDALWAAGDTKAPLPYSDADVDLLGEVADTILPATDTPGARDAAVGPFIARYSAACYPPEHIALLKSGILDIDARMQALQGKGFQQADEQAKISLLTQIDRQAKEHARVADAKTRDESPHYFTLMKQLTLYGFFTSEPGATRVARYRPVPGKYRGCIPYVKGETFWAW
jgi:Gluconate 2-dehydrogenase subunit 3